MKPAKVIKIRFIEIVFKLFGFAILQKDIDKSPFFLKIKKDMVEN